MLIRLIFTALLINVALASFAQRKGDFYLFVDNSIGYPYGNFQTINHTLNVYQNYPITVEGYQNDTVKEATKRSYKHSIGVGYYVSNHFFLEPTFSYKEYNTRDEYPYTVCSWSGGCGKVIANEDHFIDYGDIGINGGILYGKNRIIFRLKMGIAYSYVLKTSGSVDYNIYIIDPSDSGYHRAVASLNNHTFSAIIGIMTGFRFNNSASVSIGAHLNAMISKQYITFDRVNNNTRRPIYFGLNISYYQPIFNHD